MNEIVHLTKLLTFAQYKLYLSYFNTYTAYISKCISIMLILSRWYFNRFEICIKHFMVVCNVSPIWSYRIPLVFLGLYIYTKSSSILLVLPLQNHILKEIRIFLLYFGSLNAGCFAHFLETFKICVNKLVYFPSSTLC